MKLLTIIPLICAIYVIYRVWFKDKSRSFFNKLIWTLFAVVFNILTALAYILFANKS